MTKIQKPFSEVFQHEITLQQKYQQRAYAIWVYDYSLEVFMKDLFMYFFTVYER